MGFSEMAWIPGCWWLEHGRIMTFHSVGNGTTDPNWRKIHYIFQRGRGWNHQPDIVTLGDISIYIYIYNYITIVTIGNLHPTIRWLLHHQPVIVFPTDPRVPLFAEIWDIWVLHSAVRVSEQTPRTPEMEKKGKRSRLEMSLFYGDLMVIYWVFTQ
jgi:hypothetical protein